jgi:HAD superfamily hydrolase (TIGR01484 family)
MNTKLIVTDLDGTLLDSPTQKLPSDDLATIIRKLQNRGILVACATGRALSWTRPVMEAAQFSAPCIVGGGSMLVDPSDYSIIEQHDLPQGQLDKIKTLLKNLSDTRVLFNDYTDSDYMAGGRPMPELLAAASVSLIDILDLPHTQANQLVEQLNNIPNVSAVKMNGYRPPNVDVLVSHRRATKSEAIRSLQHYPGVDPSQTIGIGNGHNDIQIFNAVGTKIAVANAVPELLEAADIIIGDAKNQAVEAYLRGLLLA